MFDKYNSYKGLIKNIIISDFKLKYRGSILSFLWALIEPLLLILILYFVFSTLFTSETPNYAAYLIIGFTVWFFFANGTSMVDILISRKELINKSKIPPEIIIFSSLVSLLITEVLSFIILLIILFFIGIKFNLLFFFIPLFMLLEFIFILGISFLLNCFFVFMRDVSRAWNILLQAWFFATPIVYPVSLLKNKLPLLLKLNPMSYFVSSYRDILLYNTFNIQTFLVIFFLSLSTVFFGYFIFLKYSKKIMEEV
jgi:lipopolysaccharide transport system permease protein